MTKTNLQAVSNVFSIVLVCSAALMAEDPQPVGDVAKENPGDWIFVQEFSDEFEGDQVDAKKWNVDTEDFGIWSWEPENTLQRDGSLHLQMVQETHQRGGKQLFYKSGIARSLATVTYGYFEARVKGCERFPGASPAFWLYSRGPNHRYQSQDGETVVYSEIDVMELQQCEYNFKTKKRNEVNHIDCNLHTTVLRNGNRQWIRPNTNPEICKNEFNAAWDPREDYHVYAVENTREWVIWYVDGQEIAKKPNLYWHLPMHVTLSLGLRHPFESYKSGERSPVPEATTKDGFPTTMSVDYVRVWRNRKAALEERLATPKGQARKIVSTDMSKAEYLAAEKAKWEKNGWNWNQAKVESNFAEIDSNHDGLASGQERQAWYAQTKASTK